MSVAAMKRWWVALLIVSSTAMAAPKRKHRPPAATPAAETPAPSETAPAETATPTAETTPAPPPPPPPPPPTPEPAQSKSIDLESLNAEYNQLRDELFRSRAKAHLIGDALFKTKVVATFQYKAQRAWPIKKVTLKIDDQPVFSGESPPTADPLKLYDGFAAPGRHTLTVHVDCGATGEDRVAYGAEGAFVVDLAENKQTNVVFIVDETGDGPGKLAKKRQGAFDVRVKAELETVERPR
jgi:hypothetical protein